MPADRIIDIRLDERTIIRRSDEVEQEKKVAIYDLLHDNSFALVGHEGPYRILLRVEDDRLAIEVMNEQGEALDTVRMALTRFRKLIKSYFAICESYFKAVKSHASPAAIEPVDMARRGIHNEAAELLTDCLKDKIALDFDTARRLFTLICVLHIR